jgi:hypothetical protein
LRGAKFGLDESLKSRNAFGCGSKEEIALIGCVANQNRHAGLLRGADQIGRIFGKQPTVHNRKQMDAGAQRGSGGDLLHNLFRAHQT